jgi:hypothetical protein
MDVLFDVITRNAGFAFIWTIWSGRVKLSVDVCRFVAYALFSLPQSSKFFHSLSITLIFNRLHGVLNVGKKITNYTV